MKWNQRGFTLVEMLVVFSIFLGMSTIGVFLINPHYLFLEKDLFFSQFKSDIFYAQQYAISHQSIITVNILPERNYYYIREKVSGSSIVTRQYSNEISLGQGTMPLFFQFSANGNINCFGSFFASVGADTYRITFLIGSGRFYVTKE